MCGCKGCKGITLLKGNGIVSTVDNNNGTFTITYDNGDTFTTSNFTGPTGAPALRTGYTEHWLYNNTTTPSGANQVRFDSTLPNSITKIYLSDTNYNGTSVVGFTGSLYNGDASGSFGAFSRFGDLKVFLNSNLNEYIVFKIVNITSQTGYLEIDVLMLETTNMLSVPFTTTNQVGITFTPNTSIIDTMYVPITGWNMDTTNLFNVTIASLSPLITDFTKIVSVEATIFTNTLSACFPLNVFYSSAMQGSIETIDVTNIVLSRVTSGIFDDAAFNAATGHLLIKYLR